MVRSFRFGVYAVSVLIAACAVMAGPWVGGRGPGNRNAFADVTFPPSPSVVWKSYIGEGVVDAPPSNALVVGDTVIVAYGRNLVAVGVETGEGRWATILPENPVSDLLYLDNQIVVSFAGGSVFAFDPSTGSELWKCKLNGGIRNGPQYTDDVLIYATKSRAIQVVARKTGANLGTIAAQGNLESAPLLLGEYFFLSYADGRVMRVEAKTGIMRWSDTIPNTVVTLTPVTDGRTVLVTATTGIYAFNPFERTAARLWGFPCGERLQDPVTLDGDHVYVATSTGKIYCLDLATGKHRWVRTLTTLEGGVEKKIVDEGLPLHAVPIASPLVLGTHLLVRMQSGLMALYQKDSGKLEWLYRLKPPTGARNPAAPYMGAPAIDGDHLYFAGTDGYIYHLSASAPDVDPPAFSDALPRSTAKGFVIAEGLNYVGAVVSDEGSGLQPSQLTMKLDGVDLTSAITFEAKSGYFYVGLHQDTPLAMGLHRLEIAAKDSKGNTGTLDATFIVAPYTSTEIIPVTIGGEFLPKHLKVAPGTIIAWTNTTGSPRTIISDLQVNDKPLFSSDAQYPQGIQNGESWVWIVPQDVEFDTRLYYHCRINGAAGSGEDFGTGLAGLIEVVEPVKHTDLDGTAPTEQPGEATPEETAPLEQPQPDIPDIVVY